MEVKIGVQHAPREIVLESGQSAEEVERIVADALAGKAQLLTLVDEHGRKVLVPAERLAYVELGEPERRHPHVSSLHPTLHTHSKV
ncbi:DUF3107 domain-containing protein [Streptomyces sp. NPDC057616]|uniref:DUF3107 domain-containing protein n=1 Tax=Streptomyces sp. NPDC057616 TaxID=3346183 RepID=UPI00368B787B